MLLKNVLAPNTFFTPHFVECVEADGQANSPNRDHDAGKKDMNCLKVEKEREKEDEREKIVKERQIERDKEIDKDRDKERE